MFHNVLPFERECKYVGGNEDSFIIIIIISCEVVQTDSYTDSY